MASSERLPWGSLPWEHYVQSKWTSLATDDLSKRRLLRPFCECLIHMQSIESFSNVQQQLHVSRYASQARLELLPQLDWESILAPIRTDFQRQLASPYSFQPDGFHCWDVVWLPTCYDAGTDEAHQRLLDEPNQDLALEVEENILNDVTLYDYSDDWHRIFEVIPERLFEEVLDGADIRDTPEEHASWIREAKRNLNIDEMTDIDTLKNAAARFHSQAVCKYPFIADKVALATRRIHVVFFDDCGRTVRQSRVQPEHCREIAGAWFDGFIEEMEELTDADIGPDYLSGGLCGPPDVT
jgi:hypothetical protein